MNFLKWSLYTRLKRNLINLKIFRFIKKELIISVFILGQLLKLLMVISFTNLILNESSISVSNQYLNTILKSFIDNKLTFFILFFIYIILFLYQNSIKSVNLNKDFKFKQWLLVNTSAKENILDLFLYLDYIIFKSIEVLTLQVPVITVILIRNDFKLYIIILFSILYTISIILLSILGSLIYNLYLSLIIQLNSITKAIFVNLIKIIPIIILLNFIGRSLSDWISKFPLVKKVVLLSDFQDWLHKFKIDFIDDFFRNFNNFNMKLAYIDQIYLVKVMIMLSIILYMLIIIFNKINRVVTASTETKSITFNNSHYVKRGLLATKLKIYVRSKYLIRKSNILCGSIFYWGSIGLYTGLLKTITPNSKMYYFLIISYIFYSSYALINSIFENLSAKVCIDGEGKNIYWWIHIKLSRLFKYKRYIFLFYIFIIINCSNFIIFTINNIKISDLLLIFLLQIIFSFTLYNIFSIPSILFSHFNYSNIEELNDYADRKKLYETITYVIPVICIPILVLPTALFMTDYIVSLKIYILIQFILVSLMLILINITLEKLIIKRIDNKEYIYSIFEI